MSGAAAVVAGLNDIRVPPRPGCYALLLDYRGGGRRIRIGQLGEMHLEAGRYVYVGSAAGPGGLRGRLRHHVRAVTRPHWHIDYLRKHGVLAGAWFAEGMQTLEHGWSRTLAAMEQVTLPLRGFGASDCSVCPTHLVAFPATMPREQIGSVIDVAAGFACSYLATPDLRAGLE